MRNLRPVILLLLLIALGSSGQAQTFTFQGTVLDDYTRGPLQNAQVRVEGAKTGAITGENGQFSLQASVRFPVLVISHVGYRPLKYALNSEGGKHILIRLEPIPVEIGGVSITAEKIERVYPDPLSHVFAYEFVGDEILFLVRDPRSRRSKLVLYSFRDSILDIALGPEPLGALYRDCFGEVHAFSKKFAYQTSVLKGQILLQKDSLELFEEKVRPALGYLQNNLFYKTEVGPHETFFHLVGQRGKRKRIFYHTQDAQKKGWIADDALMQSKGLDIIAMTGDGQRDGNALSAYHFFNERVALRPIIVPLRIVGKQILIFDHPRSCIARFDSRGNELGTVGIAYHKERFWQKTVLVDEVRKEVFTLFRKDGQTTLHEIDLNSGQLGNGWTIPKEFISRIRIRDGWVYFLYKNSEYDPTQRLFRMQIK